MPEKIPLSYLQSSLLFKDVPGQELENFRQHCSLEEFRTGDRVHISGRGSGEVPIFVVVEGCLAIYAPTVYGKYEEMILALIMPSQLVGEFEYLGGVLPERLEVIAVDETKLILFPSHSLKDLIKRYPAVAYNLARTVLTKQNISNFRLEAVCQTKGDQKIATLLLGFMRIPEWKPPAYKDMQYKQEMPLTMMWTLDLFTSLLSCDVRTARDGLLDLVEARLITIQWFNNETLLPRADITLDDEKELGKKHSKVNERTYFRISITRPNKLEEYCA